LTYNNTRLTILDLQFFLLQFLLASQEFPLQGTKRLMCHRKAQNVTIAQHKNTFIDLCHWMAPNVPQHCTKCATALHKMCHSMAQNVLQHGSKRLLGLCATGTHKMCHIMAQKDF
jgi:hypothetical protein